MGISIPEPLGEGCDVFFDFWIDRRGQRNCSRVWSVSRRSFAPRSQDWPREARLEFSEGGYY